MTPRLLVEIRFGRLAGRKALVAPGAKLRVGRTDRADLVVPHDGAMSGLHFELTWDGAICRLRNLSSAPGTILNGRLVGEKSEDEEESESESEVAHASWIRAGDTMLAVYVEGKTPPPRSAIEDDEDLDDEERARRGELRAAESERRRRAALAFTALHREAARAPLYMVLDGARDPRILELLHEAPDEHRSLYEGTRGEALEAVAPYLVRFRDDSGLLERLMIEGWERRWGVFLASPLSFRDMRRHLRRFLMVEVEDTRQRLYFRFYDPGVLREFMPTCSVRQVAELLGEAEAALGEGADGSLMRFVKAQPTRTAA
jgi:hypothetical protein